MGDGNEERRDGVLCFDGGLWCGDGRDLYLLLVFVVERGRF